MSARLQGGTANARNLSWDTLRGVMLIGMAVNHLDTNLRILTDHVFGFVTTAEGFVFLSGLVAGMVYTRNGLRDGWNVAVERIRKRARQIYGYHLFNYFVAFAGMLGLAAFFHGATPVNAPKLFIAHPLVAALLGPLLLYQPGLLDILPMYAVFMLLLPFVLRQLEAGRWPSLLAVSVAFWLVAQLHPAQHLENAFQPWCPVKLSYFDPFAWQFLFFSGVFIGHRKARSSAPLIGPSPLLLAPAILLGGFFWYWKCHYLPDKWAPLDWVPWSDKTVLAPLRLLNFVVLAYLFSAILTVFPRALEWRPLAFLGQHSLQVFTFQCLLILFLLTQSELFDTETKRLTMPLLVCATLWLPAWAHARLQRRRKHSPVLSPVIPAREDVPTFGGAAVRNRKMVA